MNNLDLIAQMTAQLSQRVQTEADKDHAVTDKIMTAVGGDVKEAVQERRKVVQARIDGASLPKPSIIVRKPENPNDRYIQLPKAVEKFVDDAVSLKLPEYNGRFKNAAEYFSTHAQLLEAVRANPAHVPSPMGWGIEYTAKHQHIDLNTLLTNASLSATADTAQKLKDLIRWACTVQRAQEADKAQGNLTRFEKAGAAADEKLRDSVGSAMLTKFLALVALCSTKQFAGKPEKLAKLLLESWDNVVEEITYLTPLSVLNAYPSMNTPEFQSSEYFAAAGSLSGFAEQHGEHLISEYRKSIRMRTPESQSVNINTLEKHGYISVERSTLEAESPVYIKLGYQAQLAGGSSQDRDGLHEGHQNYDCLTIKLDKGTVEFIDGYSPEPAAKEAVQVLKALNEAGK